MPRNNATPTTESWTFRLRTKLETCWINSNIVRTFMIPRDCFQHTDRNFPLHLSTTLFSFSFKCEKWDEFTLKLILVMGLVTILKRNVERVPKTRTSHSTLPSSPDSPTTLWHTDRRTHHIAMTSLSAFPLYANYLQHVTLDEKIVRWPKRYLA